MTTRLKPQLCVIDREGDVTRDVDGDGDVAERDTFAPGLAPHTLGLVLTLADCENPPAAWIAKAIPVLDLYGVQSQHAHGLIATLFIHVIAAARAEAAS